MRAGLTLVFTASIACLSLLPRHSTEPARVVLAAPAADGADASPGATSYNSQRKVAVFPGGERLAVVYVDRQAGIGTALAKVSADGGQSWSALPPLSAREALRPSAAWDGTGDLHVAWTELTETNLQVMYARWAGGTDWHDREQMSDTPGYSGYPSLAVDSRDRMHVVWYGFDGSQYQIYYRHRDRAADWSATAQATRWVSDANAPAIAVGPDDSVHVVFFAFVQGDSDVLYMTGGDEGWSAPERVNPEGMTGAQPSIAVDEDGVPAVAFARQGTDAAVFYTERRGGKWLPPWQVSAAAAAPSVVALPGGGAAVVYGTLDGRVAAAIQDHDRAWSDQILAAGGARWPSASWAAFPDGPQAAPVHVVWTEPVGDGYRLGSTRVVIGSGIALPDSRSDRRSAAALVAVMSVLAIGLGMHRRR